MNPHVEESLLNWRDRFEDVKTTAAVTMKVAFPPLQSTPPPTGCCETRMGWQDDDTDAMGYVCVDDSVRATLRFEHLPQAVAGRALDEVFGLAWFKGAADGIATAEEGHYSWCDDSTTAEWDAKVNADGTVDLDIIYSPVPDIVELLDVLHDAYEAQAQGAQAAT
ncbi:hypothetical protein [Streptomyces sp. NPDC093707]|uniref:hypothetical protein n=1 Tax=Streptomyces sp. NPDC093707 TaxID=3154984 RepID=UPI00344CA578